MEFVCTEMSEIDTDLEDEIPTNEIVSMDTDLRKSETSLDASHNFIKILMDEELEESLVEYIDYTDDYLDNDDKGEIISVTENRVNTAIEYEQNFDDDHDDDNNPSNINKTIKEEPEEIENVGSQYDSQELYYCNSCNINFHSVLDHINEFHKNQSVFIENDVDREEESAECGDPPFEKRVKEESDHIIISDELPYEYPFLEEETNTDKNGEMITKQKHYKSTGGRSYRKKKSEIFDIGAAHSERENKCQTCNQIFYSLDDFIQHDCANMAKGKALMKSKLEVLQEPQNIHPCTECGNVFSSHRSLASHLRIHKNSRKETICAVVHEEIEARCEVCNTLFPSIKSLKLHRRMHNPVKVKPIEEAVGYELKSVAKDGAPNETFYCELCDKNYGIVFQEIHKKAHKTGPKLICSVCNKKFPTKVNLTMHMKVHQDQNKPKGITKAESNGIILPYECSFCGRQFVRPHEKVKHERIHTGEKPHKCEICGKCFRVSYCLTLHLRTHTGARPYVCPHCNKRFKAYGVYNHHLMTHSEERPYKCPYCPKAFKTSVQLGGHKNSHTKPFSCPDCNRPFASLYAVKAHMETHKKGSQNLKHRCEICGAIYARIFALRDHLKEQHQSSLRDDNEITTSSAVPTRISAEGVVLKSVTSMTSVTEKKNNQTLKYRCDVCGAAFARMFTLRDHIKVQHQSNIEANNGDIRDMNMIISEVAEQSIASERNDDSDYLRYLCSICAVNFNSMAALRDHTRNVHQTNAVDCEVENDIISEVGVDTPTYTIILDNEDEITVGTMEHFQTEEVVTDWLR